MTLTIRRLPDDDSNEDLIIIQVAIKGNCEVYQLRDFLQLHNDQLIRWCTPIGLFHGFSKVPMGTGLTFIQHPDGFKNCWKATVLSSLERISTINYNNDTNRIVVASDDRDELQNELNKVALDCTSMAFLVKVVNGDENYHSTRLHES